MAQENSTVEQMRKNFLGKSLYLVFLKPTDTADERGTARKAHFDFVKRLESSGKLFLAGPYIDEQTGKPTGEGLFIMIGDSVAEIEQILKDDPFYQGGYRTYQIRPWRLNEGRMAVTLNFSDKSLSLG